MVKAENTFPKSQLLRLMLLCLFFMTICSASDSDGFQMLFNFRSELRIWDMCLILPSIFWLSLSSPACQKNIKTEQKQRKWLSRYIWKLPPTNYFTFFNVFCLCVCQSGCVCIHGCVLVFWPPLFWSAACLTQNTALSDRGMYHFKRFVEKRWKSMPKPGHSKSNRGYWTVIP